jgi:hypothetical protein
MKSSTDDYDVSHIIYTKDELRNRMYHDADQPYM